MLVNKVIGLLGVLFATRFTNAVELDLDNYESLQNATSLIAYGLMDYYTGNQYGKTVGMFSDRSSAFMKRNILHHQEPRSTA